MKIQNKFLLMLIIAFSFFIFLNNKCFASTYLESNMKTTVSSKYSYITLPDLPDGVSLTEDKVILSFCNSSVRLYVIPEKYNSYYCIAKGSNCDFSLFSDLDTSSSLGSFKCYSFGLNSGDFKNADVTSSKTWGSPFTASVTGGGSAEIFYSSVNLYSNSLEPFFQLPVVEKPTQEPTGIIAPLLDQQKMKGTTTQILVILPLIIVVVVSFLGLRKALKMLSQILHRS